MSDSTNVTSLSERLRQKLNRAQRAAVIVSVLGETVAKPVVDRLNDDSLAQIASGLESIRYVSREDVIAIVLDFIQQLRDSIGALNGGPERAREILIGIVDRNRLGLIFAGGSDAGDYQSVQDYTGRSPEDIWKRLAARDPIDVAGYLNRLSPNLVAIILSSLDPAVASSILIYIEDQKLSPTLSRMVDPPKLDQEIEQVVCRMIEMEFLNVSVSKNEHDERHLEGLGEMLSLVPNDKRDNIVDILRRNFDSKMPRIQRGLLTIEELPQTLPRVAVPIVFRDMKQDVLTKLLASLRSDHPQVLEHLLANISQRLAQQYKDELTDYPKVPAAEAETVQRDFLSRILDMRRRGQIQLVKPA